MTTLASLLFSLYKLELFLHRGFKEKACAPHNSHTLSEFLKILGRNLNQVDCMLFARMTTLVSLIFEVSALKYSTI